MSSQANLILNRLINYLAKAGGSRLHLEVGSRPVIRADQKLAEIEGESVLGADFLDDVVNLVLAEEERKTLAASKSVITTRTFEGNIRFKIHVFYQKNGLAVIFTYIPSAISDPISIGLTPEFMELLNHKSGLIVVSGYHGSGRTTTVLALLNYLNVNTSKYILTVEKPVEYILTSQKSIIEQREIGRDAESFPAALDFLKDSDVDVVYVSEATDYATLQSILNLVSSGRLVILVTEASSAADSVAHLVELAPEDEMMKLRNSLAEVILGIVVQQLIPRRGGGQISVTEILITNAAVMLLIKEGRFSQLTSIIQSSREEGMRSLDQALLELVKTNEVEFDVAFASAENKVDFKTSARKFISVK